MNPDYKIYEEIDRYLEGAMSAEEHTLFENRMESDPELESLVDAQKLAHHIFISKEMLDLKETMSTDLNEIHRKDQLRKNIKTFILGLIGVSALVAGGIYLNRHEGENVVKQEKETEGLQESNTTIEIPTTTAREEITPTKPAIVKIKQHHKEYLVSVDHGETTQVTGSIPFETIHQEDTSEVTKKLPSSLSDEEIRNTEASSDEKTDSPLTTPECPDINFALTSTPSFFDVPTGVIRFSKIKGGNGTYKFFINQEAGYLENESLESGHYSCYIEDENKCKSSVKTIDVKALPCLNDYQKTFTPKTDESWTLPVTEADDYLFEIYDQTGSALIKLYGYEGESQDWDGYQENGDLIPAGYYQIKISYSSGEICPYGDLTIFR